MASSWWWLAYGDRRVYDGNFRSGHVAGVKKAIFALLALLLLPAAISAEDNTVPLDDGPVLAKTAESAPTKWGLDRINQQDLPLDGDVGMDADGAGVNVYVIDTGVSTTHDELGGRVVNAVHARDRTAESLAVILKEGKKLTEMANQGELTRAQLVYIGAVIIDQASRGLRLLEAQGAPTRPY